MACTYVWSLRSPSVVCSSALQRRRQRWRRVPSLPFANESLCHSGQHVCVVWPRYTERGRWVRCWLGEQLLFFGSDFSLYSNLRCEREKEGKLQSEPVGAWLKKYTYSLLMELFPRTWLQEYSTMPRVLGILRNILYPIWCSVGNSTHVEFSKSCRILKILSNSQNPIEFSKILSNILYPIEYSYGSSEDSTIYLTVSIAYSIYSTSHVPLNLHAWAQDYSSIPSIVWDNEIAMYFILGAIKIRNPMLRTSNTAPCMA